MEGGRTASFPIELVARFSHVVEGRLTFRSRRENGVSGATMVFNLKSDIQSRQALRTITVEVPTYQMKPVEGEVENPRAGAPKKQEKEKKRQRHMMEFFCGKSKIKIR